VLGGLAAAAANAAAFVTVNVIGPEVSPWRLTYWQHLVVTHAAVGLLALETLEEDYVELQQEAPAIHSAAEWLQAAAAKMFVLVSHGLPDRHDAMLLGGILVANFVGQVLLSLGFQRMDAGRGSAVNTTQVLFGCVWDVTLLHTAPSMAMAVGAMAIAAGVYGSAVLSSSEGDGGDGGSSSLDGGRDLAGEAK
jgi:drug/metabolite transporter (DMT)-like permease